MALQASMIFLSYFAFKKLKKQVRLNIDPKYMLRKYLVDTSIVKISTQILVLLYILKKEFLLWIFILF
jgi:hypothetical protein